MERTKKRLRTRNQLKKALIGLCGEKNYYDITIDEICERAQTYRSTFYRYYDSKDKLLCEIENEYIEETQKLTPSFDAVSGEKIDDLYQLLLQELTRDMEYHWEHGDLCRFLLSPAGDIYFHNKMVASISDTFRKSNRKLQEQWDSDTVYLMSFFANGYISAIYKLQTKEEIESYNYKTGYPDKL